ncbi:MAG: OmpA family protein, partial [Flavobacteriaceae bacterium]|nr:OmpA family protein [Flavobacteriaceae bacterium]
MLKTIKLTYLCSLFCFTITAQNTTELSFYFEHDASELLDVHQKKIDSIIQTIETDSVHINIEGYTNNIGNSDYNFKLSNKRAKAIRKGFSNFKNVTQSGMGELENNDPKSRRVDVSINQFTSEENEIAVQVQDSIIPEKSKREVTYTKFDFNNTNVVAGETFVVQGILFMGGRDRF